MGIFLELVFYGVIILIAGILIGYQIGKKAMYKQLESREV